jgi:hypothetical protein
MQDSLSFWFKCPLNHGKPLSMLRAGSNFSAPISLLRGDRPDRLLAEETAAHGSREVAPASEASCLVSPKFGNAVADPYRRAPFPRVIGWPPSSGNAMTVLMQ